MKGLEGGLSSFQSAIQNGRRQVVQASLGQLKHWIVLCAVLSVAGLPARGVLGQRLRPSQLAARLMV